MVTLLTLHRPEANMSDFITVLRETCPPPVLDATLKKCIDDAPYTVNLNAYASKDDGKVMGSRIRSHHEQRNQLAPLFMGVFSLQLFAE